MSFNYTSEFIATGMSYAAYRDLVNQTLANEPLNEAAAKMQPYMAKAVTLMDEFDASYKVSGELEQAIGAAPATTWVVITEGWCGDAAYNVPMIAALEKLAPEKINLKLYLRDSNLDLIDANLTDGGRSIPKVIVLNENLEQVAAWGPRPEPLQQVMKEWKAEGLTLWQIIPKTDAWYKADETASVQQELLDIIKGYSK